MSCKKLYDMFSARCYRGTWVDGAIQELVDIWDGCWVYFGHKCQADARYSQNYLASPLSRTSIHSLLSSQAVQSSI
jgi:hypothetical protein